LRKARATSARMERECREEGAGGGGGDDWLELGFRVSQGEREGASWARCGPSKRRTRGRRENDVLPAVWQKKSFRTTTRSPKYNFDFSFL
jgi:hypothetical protein